MEEGGYWMNRRRPCTSGGRRYTANACKRDEEGVYVYTSIERRESIKWRMVGRRQSLREFSSGRRTRMVNRDGGWRSRMKERVARVGENVRGKKTRIMEEGGEAEEEERKETSAAGK